MTGDSRIFPLPGATGGGDVEEAGTSTLSLSLHRKDDECVIRIRGELDLSSAAPLRELMAEVFTQERPRRVVLDLTDLIYLDSTGLSVFVTAHKRTEAAGMELWLAGPNPSVRRLLEITALDRIFIIVDAAPSSGRPELADDEPETAAPAG